MFLLFNVVSRVGVTDQDVDVSSLQCCFTCRCYRSGCGCFFSLMLFYVSVLQIRMWMFLLFNIVSRVGITDPDVDVSSRYVVSRVGVTDPDVDVSSRHVVSRVGVTDPDVDVSFL